MNLIRRAFSLSLAYKIYILEGVPTKLHTIKPNPIQSSDAGVIDSKSKKQEAGCTHSGLR